MISAIIPTRPVPKNSRTVRIFRSDTGRLLGTVERIGLTWRASASMLAFRGTGPTSGEPADERVPQALYAPLLDSEGHHYLPGEYRTKRLAEAALLRWLDKQWAPAVGYGPHPDVRSDK